MKREVQHYLELLERRLVTLRLLAADLDESRSAYVDLDLRGMHRHISHQENLCTEIRLLDAELNSLREKLMSPATPGGLPSALSELEAQLDPALARQLQLLLSGLKTIQADVRRLSRVHSELLRRSRRSVNVLLNFLAHCSGTYPVPVARPKGVFFATLGK
jgi:DNA repair exonuclease SbcCD ATPase subunit